MAAATRERERERENERLRDREFALQRESRLLFEHLQAAEKHEHELQTPWPRSRRARRAESETVEEKEEKDHGSDGDDCATYVRGMLDQLQETGSMSARTKQVLLRQFARAGWPEKLELIATLEAQVKPPEEEEEKEAEELHEGEAQAPDMEELDELWAALLKDLAPEKRERLQAQYEQERDSERRFHMYLEFSSYLRPLTKAQLDFQADVLAKEACAPSAHAARAAAAAEKPFWLFESWSRSIFVATLVSSVVLRFFVE